MLNFQKTNKEDVVRFAPFFRGQRTHVSDFSLCYQFMWHKHFTPDFAIAEDCLILKEIYAGKEWFHYPLSRTGDTEAEHRAVAAIEAYCRDKEIRLHFTNVPEQNVPWLVLRYGQDVAVTNIRRWRDYLYEAESFRTYAGGKYSGQRNHVNKFIKQYPDWTFEVYRPEQEGELVAFLHEYDAVQRAKDNYIADEEMDEVYELVPEIEKFGLLCGLLRAGGKIVAWSIGELCGDLVVVHVDKVGVASKRREALVWRVPKARGHDRKHLPDGDPGGGEKVHEAPRLGTQRSHAPRRGKRRHRYQDS